MGELLTVSEIAERIAPAGDKAGVERITRQLRHLTLNHVLEPATALHSGPGRHRRYSGEAVYLAALMVQLSKMGFPIALLVGVAGWVRGVIYSKLPGSTGAKLQAKTIAKWNTAMAGKGEIWLLFVPRFAEDGEHLDTMEDIQLVDSSNLDLTSLKQNGYTLINLTRLFAAAHR